MSQTAENFYLAFAQGREPDSDEPEMESSLHYDQLALLVSTLEWHWRDRDDFFIGANLSVYFRRDQCEPRELRGPDFFLVRGVERRPRRSWTVWLEDGRYPDLIIELLSDETARSDRTAKKALYEGVFRTPEYFWFSPQTKELAGFHLVDAHYYPIDQDAAGRLPSVILGLRLGVAEGLLRFYTPDGALIPTLAESVALEQARAEQERLRAEQERLHAQQERACAQQAQALADQAQVYAEQERLRAEQEREHAEAERVRADAQRNRADRLAARLRALGVDPEGA
ncbi:Uma2 family endonuclease [uncultured Thiodictyon sp.]|jgi:Uma2 family endonuclease|uniref:Uma2 family endonuclease n=1 Tax=uncultured Thiodictyon sp. TaxID=1846217 RepID=UPI0025DDDFB3|nr:Uma2 family endonuclease [uncultured Thiodictyon sp.]